MIQQIQLKFGQSPEAKPLTIATTPMTVIVGPNNSGKSTLLREIEAWLTDPEQPGDKILAGLEAIFPDMEEFEEAFRERGEDSLHNDGRIHISNLQDLSLEFDLAAAVRDLQNSQTREQKRRVLARFYFPLFTIRLDGRTRFQLVEPRPVGDQHRKPLDFLNSLAQNTERRERLQRITKEAIGKYFVINPTLGKFTMGLSEEEPGDAELDLGEKGVTFHKNTLPLKSQGDGTQAFTGLAATVLSTDFQVLLIDEPEAFLHPPLARSLGRILTELGAAQGTRVFAATHSPNFLMGCVEAGPEINVVRLTYDNDVATAYHLSAERLRELTQDPLLRSSNVLSALFYKGAVVAEADTDRAFYQEINERLQRFCNSGAEDTVFLNAQNKQTIARLVGPLRELGVPAAAIVDLDIIGSGKNNKKCFRELVEACRVPEATAEGLGQTRGKLQSAATKTDFKKLGLGAMKHDDKNSVEAMLQTLADHGLFVVPVGELECWLRNLKIPTNKKLWLTKAFAMLGSDPRSEDYIKPSAGDVWAFLEKVGRWIADPHRKGMGSHQLD